MNTMFRADLPGRGRSSLGFERGVVENDARFGKFTAFRRSVDRGRVLPLLPIVENHPCPCTLERPLSGMATKSLTSIF
jgi:hypothetical protein